MSLHGSGLQHCRFENALPTENASDSFSLPHAEQSLDDGNQRSAITLDPATLRPGALGSTSQMFILS